MENTLTPTTATATATQTATTQAPAIATAPTQHSATATAPATTLITTKQKFAQLFALDTITNKDIEHLSNPERQQLSKTLTNKLNQLKGPAMEAFIAKISPIIDAGSRSGIWEGNHATITSAVTMWMRKYGTMPCKSDIAQQTGLSRQTIAKHLANYNHQPEFTEQMEQFKFMAPNVLASVYKFALNGDTKAARLYLEMVGAINKKQPGLVVNQQSNYIQINNTILSQENLKQLTPGQLNQIESIITDKGQKAIAEAV